MASPAGGTYYYSNAMSISAPEAPDGSDGRGTASSKYQSIYDLSKATVTFTEEMTYNGQARQPSYKVTGIGSETSGWSAAYKNNTDARLSSATDPPTLTLTENENNNKIIGQKDIPFTIKKAALPVRNPSTGTGSILVSLSSTSVGFGEKVNATVSGHSTLDKCGSISKWEVSQGAAILPSSTEKQSTVSVQASGMNKIKVRVTFAEGTNYLGGTCDSGELTVTSVDMSSSNTTVEIGDKVYTGSSIKPSGTDVVVKINGIKQTENDSYQIASYGTNTNAATGGGSVTLKGNPNKGLNAKNYTVYFNITRKDVSDSDVITTSPADLTYDGTARTPALNTISYKTKTLKAGSDFTVTYTNNTNAGNGTATTSPYASVWGTGNYKGEKRVYFVIKPRSMSETTVSTAAADQTFDGTAKTPKPVITYVKGDGATMTLGEGRDYSLGYVNNVLATDNCEITATGSGNFTGSLKTSFQIAKKELTITPDSGQRKYYGQGDPDTYTYTYSGDVAGYTPTVEGKVARAAGEDVGLYEYNLGTLKLDAATDADNSNYTLVITPSSYQIANFVVPSGTEATFSGVLNTATGWYWKEKVKVTAPSGYQISSGNSLEPETWSSQISYSDGDYTVNGITYFLRRDSSATDGTASAISDPMRMNTFKQDVTLPSGNIVISDNAWYQLLNTVTFGKFFKEYVDVTISGTDYASGVAGVYYLIDESDSSSALTAQQLEARTDWNELSGSQSERTFRLSSAKSVIYAKIVDRAGNISYISTDGVVIDPDAPVLEAVYTLDSGENVEGVWTNGRPVIRGKADDSLSGIMERYLTWTNESTGKVQVISHEADGSFEVRDLPDGSYKARLEAIDRAGNQAVIKTIEVRLDHLAPEIMDLTVTPSSDWINQEAAVTAKVKDEISGLASWSYSMDGGSTWSGETILSGVPGRTETCSFKITEDGSYENILLRIRDAAGNQQLTKPGMIKASLDRKMPDLPDCAVTGFEQTEAKAQIWYKGDAPQIVLTNPAYGVGEAPAYCRYRLYKSGERPSDTWLVGPTPAIVSEGDWILEYYGEDEAKNRSHETGKQAVRWDATKPEFEGIRILDHTGNPILGLLSNIFYKEGANIELDIKEEGSGLDSLTYSLNHGEPVKISTDTRKFRLPVGTTGTVVVTARDYAGNESSTTVTNTDGSENWLLEDHAPVISTFAADKNPGSTGIYSAPINVTFNVTDNDSGLKAIRVKDGTGAVIHEEQQISGTGLVRYKNITLPVKAEGKNTLLVEAEDNAGNTASSEGNWTLDSKKPDRISVRVTEPSSLADNSWINRQVKLMLEAGDSQSGITRLSYSLNGGTAWESKQWDEGQPSVSQEVALPDGIYQAGDILVEAADEAGNTVRTALSITVKQDRVSPPQAVLATDNYGTWNQGWYGGPSAPTLKLLMAGADLTGESEQKIYYTFYAEGSAMPAQGTSAWTSSSSTTGPTVSVPLTCPGEGAYVLAWYTRDGAGNPETQVGADVPVQTQIIRYDSELPEFDSTAPFLFTTVNDTPLAQLGNFLTLGNFFQETVKVTIQATDAASGLGKNGVEYTMDRKNWKTADCISENSRYSFVMPAGSKGSLYVRLKDIAGNEAGTAVLGQNGSDDWYVEGIKPLIRGIYPQSSPNGNSWYNQNVLLTAEISDEDSGLLEADYLIDGENAVHYDKDGGGIPWQDKETKAWHWEETLSKEGQVDVKLTVKDRADNGEEESLRLLIDKQEPSDVAMTAVDLPAGTADGDFVSQDITVRVDARDVCKDSTGAEDSSVRTSGIEYFSVSLDGGHTWSERRIWNQDDLSANTFIISRDGLYDEETAAVKSGFILLRLWDAAGNLHETKAQGSELLKVRRDTKAPEPAILNITSSGSTPEGPDGWYNGPTAPAIELRAEEAGPCEAPNHVYWSLVPKGTAIPDRSTWECDGTPVIPGEGIWVLTYETTDEAGNASGERDITIRYDCTPPTYGNPAVTYRTVNDTPLAQLGNALTFGNFFKEAVKVTIHISDTLTDSQSGLEAASGISRLSYTLVDSEKADIPLDTGSFTLPLGTKGQIVLYAVDHAGNESPVLALNGDGNNNYWIIENQPPSIQGPAAADAPNKAGWYKEDVEITAVAEDRESGLSEVIGWLIRDGAVSSLDGTVTGEAAKGPQVPANFHGDTASRSDAYRWSDTLSAEGEGMEVRFRAVDNAMNATESNAVYNLDKTKPLITEIKGFPTELTDQAPVVTFVATDENSGIDQDRIEVLKDGDKLAVLAEPVANTRNYQCSVTLNGNGVYTIQVTDAAGNPSEVYSHTVTQIDLSGVRGALVTITPETPNGENGFYTTLPEIAVQEPEQLGVIRIDTLYTLYRADYVIGQPEAGPPENLPEILYDRDQEATWPRIDRDGIWYLRVWTRNELGVEGEPFTAKLKVDTQAPANLRIEGVPEDWTSEDITLYALADPVGTELVSWCYTTDGKESWSGWETWTGSNSLVVGEDNKKEDQVLFKVKDLAGNQSESAPVSVYRDSERPELSIISPKNHAEEVPVTTGLDLRSTQHVETENADGTIRIYRMDDDSLKAEIHSQDEEVDVAEGEIHITIPGVLEPGCRYYVEVSDDFVKDFSGNGNQGLEGRWSFTTAGTLAAESAVGSYEVEALTGDLERETRVRVNPAKEDDAGLSQTLLTNAGFTAEDGKRYAKLRILPRYQEGEKEWTVSCDQNQVETVPEGNGNFIVWIPEDCDTAVLQMSGRDREYSLTVYTGLVEAVAEGDLNPEIRADELINNVDLTKEIRENRTGSLRLRMKVERRESLSKELSQQMVGYLPEDVLIQPLDITLYKGSQNPVHKLNSDIHLTIDLEEPYRNYRYYRILRFHDGESTLIIPTINGDWNRITFTTDSFSEYAVICGNTSLEGLKHMPEKAEDTITVKTAPGTGSNAEQEKVLIVNNTGIGKQNHLSLMLLILIFLLLLLVAALAGFAWRRERRRRKKEHQESDKETGTGS